MQVLRANVRRGPIAIAVCLVVSLARAEDWPEQLRGTQPLTASGDLAAPMRAGIDRFLDRETEASIAGRAALWNRDYSSPEAFEQSVRPNRERFRRMIGAVDERLPVTALEYLATTAAPALLAENDRFHVYAVRWPVFEGVYGEGLLLQPRTSPRARVVAIPDADQTPEMITGLSAGVAPNSQFARRLAELGCQVIVPVLISREDTHSGNPRVWLTNQPHREWVYRTAYDFGRHIIGFEVQKVLAAVDWFVHEATNAESKNPLTLPSPPEGERGLSHNLKGSAEPIGVAGYGEGALVAFHAAALDPRIQAALVSGYFDSRQHVAAEPIYRNLFGLLAEFGDAEIVSLIVPRALIVEHSEAPKIDGPPARREDRRKCAAPGVIRTPEWESVKGEVDRARSLFPAAARIQPSIELIAGDGGATVSEGSHPALSALLLELGHTPTTTSPLPPGAPLVIHHSIDPAMRQQRQLQQLVDYTQRLLAQSEFERAEFWKRAKPTSVDEWRAGCQWYRDYFWDEVIGRFPPATLPPNPRTRKLFDKPTWTGYEVMLDVWPDVFCWGILLVPKDIKQGERRPVVVCQHGLEGEPVDVVDTDPAAKGYGPYKGFAAQLAERGFITYAPHNFYRGGDEFRQLQRKLNPLKKSMYSIIVAQHQRHLEWLGQLPFVDAARIGFYGLSYGGFTAVRIPPLLDGYALSISSAEFNDMVRKKAAVTHDYSYPFHITYEVFEFNLANTFSYGDLVGLIAPRPFMVERGHADSVAPDEWVASEYAKVRRLYTLLGIQERTQIEFFNGPHTINGVGTFAFLHRFLEWPAPGARGANSPE